MSTTLVRNATATCEDPDGRGGLTIFLSSPENSTARWRFSVRAHTDVGLFHIGEFITCPPVLPGTPNEANVYTRAVAVASIPGARDWTVFATLAAGEADHATLDLAVGWPMGPPGLHRVGERYKQYSASVAGAVNILAGETVIAWSAAAAGAGVSVQIGSFGAIAIPAGGALGASPAGTLKGPVTFTFVGANLSTYLIEVAESA